MKIEIYLGGELGSSDCTPKVYVEQPANATNVDNHEGLRFIACSVCKAKIDISNKKDTFVVKCNNCNEATVRFDLIFCSFVIIKAN